MGKGQRETDKTGSGKREAKGYDGVTGEMITRIPAQPAASGMGKSQVRDFRDLLAWQQAIELALQCDTVCDKLPQKAWYLVSQVRRAANSVHSNIAEGNGRATIADYLRHLSMANASLREVESNLYYMSRRYSRIAELQGAVAQTVIVAKLLTRLIASLRRKREEQ